MTIEPNRFLTLTGRIEARKIGVVFTNEEDRVDLQQLSRLLKSARGEIQLARAVNDGLEKRANDLSDENARLKDDLIAFSYTRNETDHPESSCTFCGHRSDCATHNDPAMPSGPCNCGRKASVSSLQILRQRVVLLVEEYEDRINRRPDYIQLGAWRVIVSDLKSALAWVEQYGGWTAFDWENWANDLAARMPERWDGDAAQEDIIREFVQYASTHLENCPIEAKKDAIENLPEVSDGRCTVMVRTPMGYSRCTGKVGHAPDFGSFPSHTIDLGEKE